MSERKLFSRKDGTSFFEDLRDIFEDTSDDIRYFFQRLFGQLRNWYEIAGEPVLNFLEGLELVIADGSFTGDLIESVVEKSPNKIDDAVLEWLRSNLNNVIMEWMWLPDDINDFEDAIDHFLDEIMINPGSIQESLLDDLGAHLSSKYSEAVAKESGAEPLSLNDAKNLIRFSRDIV